MVERLPIVSAWRYQVEAITMPPPEGTDFTVSGASEYLGESLATVKGLTFKSTFSAP